jgi:hypothetical protein
MKRDMDFIRTILLKIEELGNPGLDSIVIESLFQDYSVEQINYHLKLLQQSGLIDAHPAMGSSNINWAVYGLTWNGHEFLALAQNNTIWEKAKHVVIEKIGSLGLDILSKIMFEQGMKLLGASTG